MIDIKFLLNSDIGTILEKYYSKPILCRFLLHIIKDSKNFYNHKENPKVLETQDRVIELLGDLILGKEVSSKELEAAYATASATSYAAFATAYATAAYATASATSYAVYATALTRDRCTVAASAAISATAIAATTAAYAAAYATTAAYATKEQEYKYYLIELILKENNIDLRSFKLLYNVI